MKKIIYVFVAMIFAVWIGYRIFAISTESARVVFNPFREAAQHGITVEMIAVEKKTGILKEPIFVKNNLALVSCGRIHRFKVGQVVGDGKIVSVSSKIDIDTGMCIVKTRGVANGSSFAEASHNGFFFPVYAAKDGTVMVAQDGIATRRAVKVAAADADNALITEGLRNGDNVIISNIDEGSKVR